MRLPAAALAAGLATAPAFAAPPPCTALAAPPTEVGTLGGPNGAHVLVFVGRVSFCDAARREFDVAMPPGPHVRTVTAQIALAGFTRRYGLHQIGFVLREAAATPQEGGIRIRFDADTAGLDGFELAYTLYLTEGP